MWRFAGPYLNRIGVKRKDEYSKSNQHEGKMFALPKEVSISGIQAGTISSIPRNPYKFIFCRTGKLLNGIL